MNGDLTDKRMLEKERGPARCTHASHRLRTQAQGRPVLGHKRALFGPLLGIQRESWTTMNE